MKKHAMADSRCGPITAASIHSNNPEPVIALPTRTRRAHEPPLPSSMASPLTVVPLRSRSLVVSTRLPADASAPCSWRAAWTCSCRMKRTLARESQCKSFSPRTGTWHDYTKLRSDKLMVRIPQRGPAARALRVSYVLLLGRRITCANCQHQENGKNAFSAFWLLFMLFSNIYAYKLQHKRTGSLCRSMQVWNYSKP